MGNLTLKKHKIFTPSNLETGSGGISSVIAGTNITIDNTDPLNPIINTTADDIIVVSNYSALPSAGTVSGKFYWCSASQGTSWLPGSLGGTYYNSGLYYSNGVSWEFLNVPYNATQSEVNTGTNNDKFVTPNTLKNSSQFQYLDATSSVQTQLDAKLSSTKERLLDIVGFSSLPPADSLSYFFGEMTYAAPPTAANSYRFQFNENLTITRAIITVRLTTVPTNESISFYIRESNTTDRTITTSLDASTVTTNTSKSFIYSGLSISITSGTYYEMKMVTPAWVTNPTNFSISIKLYGY